MLVIFGSMRSGKIAVAGSVGLYITAGYWFTSSTSFANPAVTIARTFTESFTGISYLNTPYYIACLLYTSPSPRDKRQSRMPSSA